MVIAEPSLRVGVASAVLLSRSLAQVRRIWGSSAPLPVTLALSLSRRIVGPAVIASTSTVIVTEAPVVILARRRDIFEARLWLQAREHLEHRVTLEPHHALIHAHTFIVIDIAMPRVFQQTHHCQSHREGLKSRETIA